MDLTKIPEKDFKDPRNRRNDPRFRLIDTLDRSPNQRKLEKSRALLGEALQDLEAAQLGTASEAIITQNDLRKELYQDLLWCYEELSKNHLSTFYESKIRELKEFCTEQLPKPPQTPVRRDKIPSGYSAITKLFIFALVLIAVVGATTLYQHYRVRRL